MAERHDRPAVDLADRLAVVDGLDGGEQFEFFDSRRSASLHQDTGAFSVWDRLTPSILGRMGGIQRQLDVLGGRARHGC